MDFNFDFICLYPFSVWQKHLGVLPGKVKAQVPVGCRAHVSFLLGGAGHPSSLHSEGGHGGLTPSDEGSSISARSVMMPLEWSKAEVPRCYLTG